MKTKHPKHTVTLQLPPEFIQLCKPLIPPHGGRVFRGKAATPFRGFPLPG